jgi:hypothetical protein
MNRREITAALLTAATFYWAKKTYSVHPEFGIERWGKRRLDAVCMNFKSNFVGLEIKSCLADYRTDKKWRNYLPYVNQFYFLFPPSVIESRCFKEIRAELKAEGAGILQLSNGKIRCLQKAKWREVPAEIQHNMLVKMAWRTGDCRRNVKRTRRVNVR